MITLWQITTPEWMCLLTQDIKHKVYGVGQGEEPRAEGELGLHTHAGLPAGVLTVEVKPSPPSD